MRKNIIRLVIFLFTLAISLVVYFVFVSYSIQKSVNLPKHVSFDSALNKIQDKTPVTDFYNIAPCADANSFKQYKYPQRRPAVFRNVLNDKVLCGVLPEYSSTRKNETVSGVVKVKVLVDEAGEVLEANVETNDSLMRRQFEKAVYQTRFRPTLLGGESIKVRGFLIYKFDDLHEFQLTKNVSDINFAP